MNSETLVRTSKFLSKVLRHQPEKIGIELDDAGWTDVGRLLQQLAAHHRPMSRADLEHLVATSDKKRYAFSEDGQMIRANQGHSIAVELGYPPQVPPERLFHGTVAAVLDSIRRDGLKKMNRHHVHLSPDTATATKVATRRGKPIILTIDSARMHAEGREFFCSENGVWLTDSVPPEHIEFPG